MSFIAEIERHAPKLASLRQKIHRHPELGFEEFQTSKLVADNLKSCGIDVLTGIGGTGVVGVLSNGSSARAIALRADMDALPIQEETKLSYSSTVDHKMHACGHDGHTTMLIGAAKYLAATKQFNGTVYFVFQPAEEGLGGARAMISDGLFSRCPVSSIYAMHNLPGIPAGQFGFRTGPIMAGADNFDIRIQGKGGHAAWPHTTIDPITIQAQIVNSLQTVVSRHVDPLKNAVVSVTQVVGGTAYNVIPDEVRIGGSLRYFEEDVASQCRESIEKIASAACMGFGARCDCEFTTIFQPTRNTDEYVQKAARAAERVVGRDNVLLGTPALMGSEDFGYMLEEVPGCYLFIGNGNEKQHSMLHNPSYDFNDEVLSIGASFWASLVEQEMSKEA